MGVGGSPHTSFVLPEHVPVSRDVSLSLSSDLDPILMTIFFGLWATVTDGPYLALVTKGSCGNKKGALQATPLPDRCGLAPVHRWGMGVGRQWGCTISTWVDFLILKAQSPEFREFREVPLP